MFKVGDIVEIAAESSATGMLDFVDGKGYEVEMIRYNFNGDFKGHIERHQEILLRDEGGRTDWYHCTHFKLKEEVKVEKKECLFKVGQVVWDVVYGKGVIVEIAEYSAYPVIARFSDETVAYGVDGRTYETHGRTLFFSEPEVSGATEPLFEPTLKRGDVVIAFDQYSHGEKVVVFEEMEGSVVSTEGTHFYKDAFNFYRLGDKVQFN